MTPDDVHAHAVGLARCTRKGNAARPAWYVDDRLVCRLEDPTTLTIRCAFDLREQLVTDHPDVFGVPPSMERHLKVQAVLDHKSDDVVRSAITAAWELQRRW